jgi:ribosomal protein RSM22 (predicted rRNA methylase)
MPFAPLKRAAEALSDSYRGGRRAKLAAAERIAAYLATRMPATYAAAHAALTELAARLGAATVESVLDIGAGSGAASLAARSVFPVSRITLVERDRPMLDAASAWLPDAAVLEADAAAASLPPHDLVIAAYSLGEMQAPPLAAMWRAARVALVVIEPGRPEGHTLIQRIRDELLAAGAFLAAPCPMAAPCPLPAPDWCHFAARVERSSIHRRLKGGELSYEDEKFSYVAFTRDPALPAQARIIRRPDHRPGLITLETCTPSGVRRLTVGKRTRDQYRAARHAAWGAEWKQ